MKFLVLFVVLPIIMFFLTFLALALFSVTTFSDPYGVFFPSWYLSTVMVICTIIIVHKIGQSKK